MGAAAADRARSPRSLLLVFGLLFASADALFAQWADALVPDITAPTRWCCGRSSTALVAGATLVGVYVALNPPQVEHARPAGREAGPPAVRVAGAGRHRGGAVRGVRGGPARCDVRRARLPAADDRADLRGVRPPGVRPAHRRHPADPRRGRRRGPQGVPRDSTRPAAAAGGAGAAVPAHPGGRRVGVVPDARLRAGLRLHPAAAAGLGVRGLARPRAAAGARRRAPAARVVGAARRAADRGRVAARAGGGQPGRLHRLPQRRPVRADRQGGHGLPGRAVRRRGARRWRGRRSPVRASGWWPVATTTGWSGTSVAGGPRGWSRSPGSADPRSTATASTSTSWSGYPSAATPSRVLGASWSPKAARTTSHAATRSERSADATYTVERATSVSRAPAASSATTRLAITWRACDATSPGATTVPCSSSGHAPAVQTVRPAGVTAA